MATTAADILVNSLLDWGVEVVFGIPGDGINGIMEALRKCQDKIRFIQVRHEEAAAFMACGWAKFTGKLGVCLATSGPGGIHLLNGLYDAKGDGQPVLAITGMHYHDLLSTHAQQDVELDKLFQDVCVYNARVMGPAHVENVADLACRMAVTRHGVAHLTFPVDLQEEEAPESGSKHNVLHHTSDVFAWSAGLPEEHQLRRAADILNAASRPAILAGRGAIGAGEKVISVAEALGAPIAKAVLGKTSVDDDHPYTTGSVGLLGTTASEELMRNCDTLLMIGTSFPYIEHLPKPGEARGVQIDRDATRIGLRFPVEVGLVGDTARVLDGLLPMLQRRDDRSFLHRIQRSMQEWRDAQRIQETSSEQPIKPQRLAAEIGARLREDAILAVDSGTVTAWWARHISAKRTQMHSVSGMMASMGCALPYAVAAQLAYPDRQVVAFAGDGGMAMLMADFATCVKYKLPIKVVVLKNNTLGQIKWEQLMFLGNPEYGCELHPIDFAAFARACGAEGFSVKQPDRLNAVLDEAFASAGPVIVDVEVDPLEAPMFANMQPEQAKRLKEAIGKGEPDAEGILENARKQRARELV
ncbi:MAG TPA: thiamine pyrophosphate-dependent enzyme [Bryobacteraceae bacterium]|nr:thiamine pyrophosphate-dependent enzyme [Bryobacteraceae bacterium]